MNRLRNILYTAALLVGAAACDKEDLPGTGPVLSSGERILFSAPPELTVETLTRAAQDELVEGNAFGVMGYCVPYTVGSTTNFDYGSANVDWTVKRGNCAPEVLYDQKVTVGVNGCTYDYNDADGDGNNPAWWYRTGYDTRNQPNASITGTDSYKYTFFAWYPYDDGKGNKYFSFENLTGTTSKGAPVMTFTMPQDGDNLNDVLNKDANPDAMLAAIYNHTKDDGNLKLDFSHVLTGLGFEVNNFSERELKIHKLTLSGRFYKQVKVDFSQSSSSGADGFFSVPESYYTGTYTLFDEVNNNNQPLVLVAPDATQGESVSSTNDIDGQTPIGGSHLLLISGTGAYFGPDGSGSNTQVKVNLEYTFGDERKTFSQSRPSTFTPQPGVKYTAQLNFVGNAFVLQFVVSDNESWEDGGTDNAIEDGEGNIIDDGTATFE